MLRGQTILALWNGVDMERTAEYELWHTREHVPERLTVPGMIGARRYVRSAGNLPFYLTLYEIEKADILASAPYQALLSNPTTWSRTMRPSFQDFLRICCDNSLSMGGGTGGHVRALLLEGESLPALAAIQDMFAQCLKQEEITGLHLLLRDRSIADVPFEISQAAAEIPRSGIVLVEGFSVEALEQALPYLVEKLKQLGADVSEEFTASYQLSYALDSEWLDHTITIDHTNCVPARLQN